MLRVEGKCLTCKPRTVNYIDKVTKQPTSFKSHQCWVHDEFSGHDPIVVETGEIALVPGKEYFMFLYVNLYVPRNGGAPKIEYKTYKETPPTELLVTTPAKL